MKRELLLERMRFAQKVLVNGETERALRIALKVESQLRDHFPSQYFVASLAAALGQYELARDAGMRAYALDSSDFSNSLLLVKVFVELEDWASFEKIALQARAQWPADVDIGLLLATYYSKNSRPQDAESILIDLYRLHPDNPDVISLLAVIWAHAGHAKEGVRLFDTLDLQDCQHIHILARYFDVLTKSDQYEKAEYAAAQRLDLALRTGMSPSVIAECYADYGGAKMMQGDTDSAKCAYEKALELDRTNKSALINMASLCRLTERHADAVRWYKQALEHYPTDAQILHHMNNLLREIGFPAESIKYGELALNLNPTHAGYHANLAASYLAAGRLEEGWRHYEFRLSEIQAALDEVGLPFYEEHGPTAFRRLLLIREQGIGDEVMFSSLVPELLSRFEKVGMVVHPKLLGLMARTFPECEVLSSDSCVVDHLRRNYDCQLPIGSLPKLLRRSLSDFAGKQFQLALDPGMQEQIREQVRLLGDGLKVGFAWRSTRRSITRDVHYPDLEYWQPLFSLAGVQWVNLQYCADEDELQWLHACLGERFHPISEIDHFNDLDASACVMAACDVVIVPCISTSSIAPAVGVPTIVLSSGHDHFMLGTDHYPWFPGIVPMVREASVQWPEIFTRLQTLLAGLQSS